MLVFKLCQINDTLINIVIIFEIMLIFKSHLVILFKDIYFKFNFNYYKKDTYI